MNSLVRPALPVVLLVVAVVIVAVAGIIGLLVSFPPQTSGGSTSSSAPTSVTSTDRSASSMSSVGVLTANFAAISTDDTVITLNSGESPVVINLDRRQWQQLQWSPDGKYLAALGRAKAKVANLDLYIFDTQQRNWRHATTFGGAASGITSYVWRGSSAVAFTQGTGANAWLHVYDYDNQEVRKVFQTAGQLVAVDISAQQYVIANGQYHQLVGFGGEPLASSQPLTLRSPVTGRTSGEYIVQPGSADNSTASQLWYPTTGDIKSLVRNVVTSGSTSPVPLKAYCSAGNSLLVSLPQSTPAELEVGVYSPEQNDYRQVFTWAADNSSLKSVRVLQSLCGKDMAVLQVQQVDTADKTTTGWYLVAGNMAQKVIGADDYQQMAVR